MIKQHCLALRIKAMTIFRNQIHTIVVTSATLQHYPCRTHSNLAIKYRAEPQPSAMGRHGDSKLDGRGLSLGKLKEFDERNPLVSVIPVLLSNRSVANLVQI